MEGNEGENVEKELSKLIRSEEMKDGYLQENIGKEAISLIQELRNEIYWDLKSGRGEDTVQGVLQVDRMEMCAVKGGDLPGAPCAKFGLRRRWALARQEKGDSIKEWHRKLHDLQLANHTWMTDRDLETSEELMEKFVYGLQSVAIGEDAWMNILTPATGPRIRTYTTLLRDVMVLDLRHTILNGDLKFGEHDPRRPERLLRTWLSDWYRSWSKAKWGKESTCQGLRCPACRVKGGRVGQGVHTGSIPNLPTILEVSREEMDNIKKNSSTSLKRVATLEIMNELQVPGEEPADNSDEEATDESLLERSHGAERIRVSWNEKEKDEFDVQLPGEGIAAWYSRARTRFTDTFPKLGHEAVDKDVRLIVYAEDGLRRKEVREATDQAKSNSWERSLAVAKQEEKKYLRKQGSEPNLGKPETGKGTSLEDPKKTLKRRSPDPEIDTCGTGSKPKRTNSGSEEEDPIFQFRTGSPKDGDPVQEGGTTQGRWVIKVLRSKDMTSEEKETADKEDLDRWGRITFRLH